MIQNTTPTNSWGAGWRLALYVFVTTVTSIMALAVNMVLIYMVFTSSLDYLPEQVATYGGQFFLYVGPFMLLFLEWWLWDLLADPFRK